jgi:cellulose biosynthesis protein BcsQ
MIKTRCNQCGSVFEVDDKFFFQEIQCKHCSNTFMVRAWHNDNQKPPPDNTDDQPKNADIEKWKKILESIPYKTSEADMESRFGEPLLKEIGFSNMHFYRQRNFTGIYNGEKISLRPDYACYDSKEKSVLLLVAEDKKVYPNEIEKAIKEVQEQMIVTSAQFGLANNGIELQLFQRHGKICVPRTPKLRTHNPKTSKDSVSPDNVKKFLKSVEKIKNEIRNPRRALTVMFYNHKGGVGKTTITANVGAVLLLWHRKKVLFITFDLQGDLNQLFGFEPMYKYDPEINFLDVLTKADTLEENDFKNFFKKAKGHLIRKRQIKVKRGKSTENVFLEIIPGDKSMRRIQENNVITSESLKNFLEKGFYHEYDYIFIDTTPAWYIAQKGVYASDIIIPIVDNPGFSVEAVRLLKEDLMQEAFEEKGERSEPRIHDCILNLQDRTLKGVEKETQDKLKDIGIEPNSLTIPNYREIEKIKGNTPVVLRSPNGKASKILRELTQSIFIREKKEV